MWHSIKWRAHPSCCTYCMLSEVFSPALEHVAVPLSIAASSALLPLFSASSKGLPPSSATTSLPKHILASQSPAWKQLTSHIGELKSCLSFWVIPLLPVPRWAFRAEAGKHWPEYYRNYDDFVLTSTKPKLQFFTLNIADLQILMKRCELTC